MSLRILAFAALVALGCSSSSDGTNPTHPDAAAGASGAGGGSGTGGSGGASGGGGAGGTGGASGSGGASGGAPVDASGGAAGNDAGDAEAGAPADVTLDFPSFTVPAGQSATKCVVVRLGNAGAAHVGSIHNVLSPGVFRFAVYKVDDTTEQTTPADCQPLGGALSASAAALVLSVQADDTLTLPDDVAFAVADNQMLRLELEAYNPGLTDQTVSASTALSFRATASHDAGLLLLLDTSFNVPPQATSTSTVPIAPASALASATYFGFVGYENKQGTAVTIGKGLSGSAYDPLYAPATYSSTAPPRVTLATPVQLGASEVFGLSCSWNNQTNAPLSFGVSPNDELCLGGVYYYEDVGPHTCTETFCCPGSGC